jgi:hypothetical protein
MRAGSITNSKLEPIDLFMDDVCPPLFPSQVGTEGQSEITFCSRYPDNILVILLLSKE